MYPYYHNYTLILMLIASCVRQAKLDNVKSRTAMFSTILILESLATLFRHSFLQPAVLIAPTMDNLLTAVT